MKTYLKFFLAIIICSNCSLLYSEELIIGEEKISPGINIIFEGAIKDSVEPKEFYLKENDSDIHIEALVTWSSDGPIGSVEGGFIPYLKIQIKIINQSTKKEGVYNLIPHLNMSDNFHYANNLKLPGGKDDNYTIVFTISPPARGDVGFHYDWMQKVNNNLISKEIFIYKNQNFKRIVNLKRR